MAFPTTQMLGHTELRERMNHVLGRCQEDTAVDFKESEPWPALRWRIIKTSMSMANLRDGGVIVIGVGENDTVWELTGISDEHLATYDVDDIIDALAKYASPQIKVDIVIHQHVDGNKYLVFHIQQFTDVPIVCVKNTPNDVPEKQRMRPGEVYIRATSGKPQTTKVLDAAAMHDLLELAAEFRARRFLEGARRVGLVPSEPAKAKYDAELNG